MEGNKMKKTAATIIAAIILICFSTVPAHADRKTMERILIGTGAAILGTAIFHGIHKELKPQPQYTPRRSKHKPRYSDYNYAGYRQGYKNRHHRKYRQHQPRGHWETEKIWIEPVLETKWNPSHYNRKGDWINGRYEKFIITKGYWGKNKVWVRY